MAKKILIMGLPGAGKTHFAQQLIDFLNRAGLSNSIDWFNADKVRYEFNDWDFSIEGRIRQSLRMADLANNSTKQIVIADFVAPLADMRVNYGADLTVWIDTVKFSQYSNTDQLFEPPQHIDFHIQEKNSDYWVPIVGGYIKQKFFESLPEIKINKWPVVLVATYRSGSTALGHCLAGHYNCRWYSEPTVNKNNVIDDFKNQYKSSDKKYFLKVMIDQVSELKEIHDLCYHADSYKIRLIRKNVAEHALSLYLARVRNSWVEFKAADAYTIDHIDDQLLQRSINNVLRFNQMIDQSDIEFDQTIYYEDLGYIDNTIFKKTTRPTNYHDLYQLVEEKLKKVHNENTTAF